MDYQKLFPEIIVKEQEPLKNHTTFRVGGPASCFLDILTQKQLKEALFICKENDLPFYVLGNGSNMLVSDRGYEGIILHIGTGFGDVTVEGEQITAQAGAMLSKIASVAANEGLSGLEFASGIPGSVGGAVIMNAGAYGGEIAQVAKTIRCLDRDGKEYTITGEEAEFGYRTSLFKKKELIVTEITMQLQKGNVSEIKEHIAGLTAQRKEKQPLEYPSAGSTFKRPEGYFAGKLIMDAGLRGFTVGGAQVSEKHCGFVINRGDATAADVDSLMKQVQTKVQARFGVMLEPEVIRLGSFD